MLEKVKPEKFKITWLLGIIIPLMLAIIIMFNHINTVRINQQNNDYTRTIAQEEADDFDHHVRMAKDTIDVLAMRHKADSDYSRVIKKSIFDRILFVDASYVEAKHLEDLDLYRRGFNGISGLEIDFDKRLAHDVSMVYYSPVIRQGRITGVMVGVIGQESIRKNLSSQCFGVDAEAYLVTANGRVISYSKKGQKLVGKNLFTDYHKEDRLIDCSLDNLPKENLSFLALRNVLHNEGSFGYTYIHEGEEEHSYIMDLRSNDFALMKTFPRQITAAMVARSRRDTLLVTAALVALFAIILAVIVYQHRLRDRELNKMLALLKKSSQEAQIANVAKTEFFSRMSHDMRTPLNGILGMADIALRNDRDAQKLSECMHKIKNSGSYLLGLINEVLDISKIEAGKLELKEEPICLPKMFEAEKSVLANLMANKSLTFKVEDSCKHAYVLGDSVQLKKIFFNLVSNAIKYTPEGGTVSVHCYEDECTDKAYAKYILEVSDTGIGMSPEYLKTVFEPFSRAEDVRVSKQQGTGLGLAITKTIVEAMRGSISVTSELNKGTTFIANILLKLDDTEHKQAAVQQALSLDEIDCSGYRCLLVDDNELNTEIALELLSITELEAETAVDGKDALDKFKAAKEGYFDLIFMDVQMPVMNGYEATKAIRALDRMDAKTIPIIAMTANAYAEDVKNAKAAGMNEHMAKPIDLSRLAAIMTKYLEVKRREA